MVRTYNFAVLRLTPDTTRGEAINLGVVVFRDGALDVRVGEVLTRARALFPDLDSKQLSEAVQTLQRFGSVDLPATERHRTLAHFGAFTLGELGHFTAESGTAEAYEMQVSRLMANFVRQPRRAHGTAVRTSRLVTAVRKVFRNEKLLANVGDAAAISEHKIVPEWPIPGHPSLKADLALRNGVMRVCEIVELALEGDAPPPAALFSGVVTLDVAQREVGANDTVFAYRARGSAKRIDEAISIAKIHATQVVDWENVVQRESFMHDWIMAAKVQSPMSVQT